MYGRNAIFTNNKKEIFLKKPSIGTVGRNMDLARR
jgi:hypothetical protein